MAILLFDFRGDDLFLIFNETKLKGAFLIELEKFEDLRGFFARSWDKKEFEKKGLNSNVVQCSISYSKKKGALRGLHYQIAPYEETKLVRCTKGKIFDVIVDLRQDSNTFKKWMGFELSAESYKMVYIPEGFAHGFQTLDNDSEIFYQISQYYMPEYYRGVKWDDPAFNINWPLEISVISEKDSSYQPF